MIKKIALGLAILTIWIAIFFLIITIFDELLERLYNPLTPVLMTLMVVASIGIGTILSCHLISNIAKGTRFENFITPFEEANERILNRFFGIEDNDSPMKMVKEYQLYRFNSTQYTRIQYDDNSYEWYQTWAKPEELKNYYKVDDTSSLESEYQKTFKQATEELKNVSKFLI